MNTVNATVALLGVITDGFKKLTMRDRTIQSEPRQRKFLSGAFFSDFRVILVYFTSLISAFWFSKSVMLRNVISAIFSRALRVKKA